MKKIGSYAFWGADVKEVIIGEGVAEIGKLAFWGAEYIETLTIPSTVTVLEAGLFFGASGLENVVLYNTLTKIEAPTFLGTESLTDIYFYGTEDDWHSIEMYEDVQEDLAGVTIHYLADSSDHVHDFKLKENVEANCLEKGYKTEICEGCSAVRIVETYVELGHDFGNWVVTKPASETEKGIETRYCSRCDATETRELDVTEHIHDYKPVVVESTCTKGGYTKYTCSCGESYIGEETAILGHWYGDWVVINEPTETQSGLKARYCRRCEHEQTRLIDSTGHKHKYTATVTFPTCTTEGFTTYTCECGDSYTDNAVPEYGHNFGEWIVTKQPSQTEDGQKKRICGLCNSTEIVSIPKLSTDEPDTLDAPVFKVNDAKTAPGDTVEVTVSIENNPGIVATHLMLRYDSDILTLREVRDGGLIGTGKMVAGNDLTDIPYNVIWSDALSEVNHTNDGVLVTFVFTVSENAPEGETPITIEYYAESTFNTDLEPVEFEVENGKLEITDRIAGDANGDGVVNLKDAVIIERYLAGGWGVTVEAENADVNGDGKVTLIDSVLINRYLANWDVTLI